MPVTTKNPGGLKKVVYKKVERVHWITKEVIPFWGEVWATGCGIENRGRLPFSENRDHVNCPECLKAHKTRAGNEET